MRDAESEHDEHEYREVPDVESVADAAEEHQRRRSEYLVGNRLLGQHQRGYQARRCQREEERAHELDRVATGELMKKCSGTPAREST